MEGEEIKIESAQPKPKGKKAALVLISKYFGMALKEAKDECEKLTALDRQQLASAIARQQGLTADEVNFELVPY